MSGRETADRHEGSDEPGGAAAHRLERCSGSFSLALSPAENPPVPVLVAGTNAATGWNVNVALGIRTDNPIEGLKRRLNGRPGPSRAGGGLPAVAPQPLDTSGADTFDSGLSELLAVAPSGCSREPEAGRPSEVPAC